MGIPGSLTRTARTFAATLHPDGYHGSYQGGRGFFEGWYVKLVSADRAHRLALIPGIFQGGPGATAPDEAFVQVLDGSTGESWYEAFPVSDFLADAREFNVAVGRNRFGVNGIDVDLDGPQLAGTVRFTSPLDPWPVTLAEPGVMGRYAWVPTMECYHGLVSFGHDLAGTLTLAGRELDFTGGRGYLEKDWGRAFPQAYIWMQTNHFSRPDVSLSASIARIPWGRASFAGFIVGLRIGDELHRFATYTGARVTSLQTADATITWRMKARSGMELRLRAERRRGGLLHAPIRTQMHKRVEETLDARVHVELVDASGEVVFADTGEAAGLEVHGDVERLG